MIASSSGTRKDTLKEVQRIIQLVEPRVVVQDGVWVDWVEVTPEIARQLLTRNNNDNRSISWSRVTRYANDMAKGEWVVTGEALIIDASGRAASMQHRLHACVKAGVPFVSLVVIGVPEESLGIVDSGLQKLFSQRPVLRSVKRSRWIASAVNILLAFEKGFAQLESGTSALSDKVREKTLLANPGLIAATNDLPSVPRRWGGEGIWVWLYFEFRKRDERAADDFIYSVIEGVSIEPGSPHHALRRYLERLGLEAHKTTRRTHIAALVIQAWNAVRSGQARRIVRWRPGDAFPAIAD